MGNQKHRIGIRREDKNEWEARVPLIPEHARTLVHEQGIEVSIQPSDIRAYSDDEYRQAGAKVTENLSDCEMALAVKEIPVEFFLPNKTYVFFSHTIKGQSENMPMLKTLMEKGAQLIDYEKIVDDEGRRLIFFGRHAGLVGMINSLWAYGKRLEALGFSTPFLDIKQALNYRDLDEAKEAIAGAGERIRTEGLPKEITPVVFGFAGYGNVSAGAQEIFDLLPFESMEPDELSGIVENKKTVSGVLFKTVFKEEHLVEPIDQEHSFELQDYYNHPEKYRSKFETYLPYLSVLVNAIYWENKYPRLVTLDYLEAAWKKGETRLQIIGDITCDTDGSIQCNLGSTHSGNPVYVYDPIEKTGTDGVEGRGPVVLATDNLPCELGKESSEAFSKVLVSLIPQIASADFSTDLKNAGLPDEIRRAVIVWQGKLTPDFEYIAQFIQQYKE